jgi:hypothetical protein
LPIISIFRRGADPSSLVEIFLPDNGDVILSHRLPQKFWVQDDQAIFNIGLQERDTKLRNKIEMGSKSLEAMATVKFGIKLYETGKGTPPQTPTAAKERIFEASKRIDGTYRQYLEGKDVNRYEITWEKRWLKYGKNLAAPRDPALFEGQRLLLRRIVGKRLIATFTDSDYVTGQLLQIVKPNEGDLSKYLLAVLNSSLMAYYFRKKYNRQDKTFPEIRIYELASLPIRPINFSDAADESRHDAVVGLVERMLKMHEQMAVAKVPQDKQALQRQIDATDAQIDRLVYELYGLTAEEIAIVESSDK